MKSKSNDVLIRERLRKLWDLQMWRRTPRENKGRDWSDVSTRQGMLRIARSHRKLGERHRTDCPSDFTEGIDPVDTSFQISGIQTVREKLL